MADTGGLGYGNGALVFAAALINLLVYLFINPLRANRVPDAFPSILQDAIVIGVPDERMGQRVAALIQLRPDQPAQLDDLEAHVRQQLAGYKVPRTIWLVDQIGRTPSGKADYRWAHGYAKEHAERTTTGADTAV